MIQCRILLSDILYALLTGLSFFKKKKKAFFKKCLILKLHKHLENNLPCFFPQLARALPGPGRPQQICAGLDFRRPGCQSWLSCSLAGWPWVSPLAFLSSFPQLSYGAQYLSNRLRGTILSSEWGNGYISVSSLKAVHMERLWLWQHEGSPQKLNISIFWFSQSRGKPGVYSINLDCLFWTRHDARGCWSRVKHDAVPALQEFSLVREATNNWSKM